MHLFPRSDQKKIISILVQFLEIFVWKFFLKQSNKLRVKSWTGSYYKHVLRILLDFSYFPLLLFFVSSNLNFRTLDWYVMGLSGRNLSQTNFWVTESGRRVAIDKHSKILLYTFNISLNSQYSKVPIIRPILINGTSLVFENITFDRKSSSIIKINS